MKPNKTALMYATDLLYRQEQSEQHLREKLVRKGYEEDETEAALSRLKELHYLDDGRACAHQFERLYQDSHKSVRQICLKLAQRGFPRSMIKECVPQDIFEREQEAALRTLQIKYKPSADPQKMLASLYRQGFDVSVCRAAVAAFGEAGLDDE